jgi:hypothetical protein
MKYIKLVAVSFAIMLASCEETVKKDNVTNDPDTAVLKEDPENKLNANPINDTVMNHDTVPPAH